jgi:hypothetical protein
MTVSQVHNSPWARKHDMPGTPLIPSAPTIMFPHGLSRRDRHLLYAGRASKGGRQSLGSFDRGSERRRVRGHARSEPRLSSDGPYAV